MIQPIKLTIQSISPVGTTAGPDIFQMPLPTIHSNILTPTTPLDLERLPQNETNFKTDFSRLTCDVAIIQRARKCGCSKFMRVLDSIQLTAENKMKEKYGCVVLKVPGTPVNITRDSLAHSIEGELEKAQSDIKNYIKKQKNISRKLLEELSNAPLVSQITEIINNANERQNNATRRLIEISKAVPIQVNSRFAEFDRALKLKEETIALARPNCKLEKCA